jgi:Subtilase family
VRAAGTEVTAAAADADTLRNVIERHGATMFPLLGLSEERVRHQAASVQALTGAPVPDLAVFYYVDAPDDRLDALAAELSEHEAVDGAYVKPPAALAQVDEVALERRPSLSFSPTPDFEDRQGYLDPAPGGIDARYAWTLRGGRGWGVNIIDIEEAWRFSHEDLTGGLIGGEQYPDVDRRNHGAAVQGVVCGTWNNIGVTGICSDATFRGVSQWNTGVSATASGIVWIPNTAAAIVQAANALNPGDIILIVLQREGRPLEWWEDDFQAIRYATALGVVVVEAAANGGNNLDHPVYATPGPGFPSGWTNPFNRNNRDSGAIVVGAGNPPPGTHGQDYGPDRKRFLGAGGLPPSNYGSMVDAQGWGIEVTTCGYGRLQGGPQSGMSEDLWYTDSFCCTSTATPIVGGAIACLQGVLSAIQIPKRTPAQMRHLLRVTGTPQPAPDPTKPTERIGNRPNLRQLINHVIAIYETIPDLEGWILFGVTNDGSGVFVTPSGLKPVPPRGPEREELIASMIGELAELLRGDQNAIEIPESGSPSI